LKSTEAQKQDQSGILAQIFFNVENFGWEFFTRFYSSPECQGLSSVAKVNAARMMQLDDDSE
jgi:hypothetical protein